MKDTLFMEFGKKDFRECEKKILAGWKGEPFAEVGMKEKDTTIECYFDITGIAPISELKDLRTVEKLNIIKETAAGIDEAADMFIFPDRYEITEETVYTNESKDRVRFLFVPRREKKMLSDFYEGAINIAKMFVVEASEGEQQILNKAVGILSERTFGIEKAIRGIDNLKKEVHRGRPEIIKKGELEINGANAQFTI